MAKNYYVYQQGKITARARMFKLAQRKNHELMRSREVEQHREVQHRLAEMLPLPAGVTARPCHMGGVPCEWISTPAFSTKKVILYIHGGSWVFGDQVTARAAGAVIAEFCSCQVLAVDYRLAPEHPWPAGLEDCAVVYRALLGNGFEPDKIALFGDSAGGNLSLCLLQKLIQEQVPLPAAVACASPVTDLTQNSQLSKQKPDLFYNHYKGEERDIYSLYLNGSDPENPLVSPIRGDLGKLPPVLIHVGGDEALCEDNVAFAQEAGRQGGDVLCIVWPELFHDFTLAGRTMQESRESLWEIAAFFKQHL